MHMNFLSYKANALHVHSLWALKHIRCVHRVLNFELVQHKCLLLIPEFYCANRTSKFTGSYFKIQITYGHKMKANLRLRPHGYKSLKDTIYVCSNHYKISRWGHTKIDWLPIVLLVFVDCIACFCFCKAMDKKTRDNIRLGERFYVGLGGRILHD